MLRPRIALVSVLLLAAAGSASAQVYSPVAWSSFDATIGAYQFGGAAIRDATGNKDGSTNNGNPSGANDISGGNGNTSCNPTSNGTQCGTSPSAYYGMWTNGTPTADDDVLFFRMRIDGDPTSAAGFSAFHWNVLISSDADGYKEFWIDLDGSFSNGADAMRIYYEDNASQQITDTNSTQVAWLDACNTAGASCGGSGRPSFTRTAADTTNGGWLVDFQVPMALLDDATGLWANPNIAGSGYTPGNQIITPSSSAGFLYSTGNANNNPVQKDYSAPCNTPPTGTCTFGDPATTPVTLSHVASRRGAAGVIVDFGTELEVGHGGFIVEILQAGQWKAVEFVPGGDGALPNQRREYRVALPAAAERFRLIELDALNHKRVHGPFETGRSYGDSAAAAYRPIDWKSAALDAQRFVADAGRQNKAALAAKAARPTTSMALIEIDVQQSGVVRISGAELRALGVFVDAIDTQAYALARGTQVLPLHTSRSGGTLADGDYIEFVADFSPTLYARGATYTLYNDRSRAERTFVREAAVPNKGNQPEFHYATRSFERNAAYSFAAPVADPFYAARVLAYGNPASYSTQIVLDRPYAQAGSGILEITLWGGSDFPAAPDHHVRVNVNGQNIADHWFDGTEAAVLATALDASTLATGVLNVEVQLPFDNGQIFDLVNYDKAEVTYARQLYADRGALDFELDADIVNIRDSGGSDVSAYAFDTDKLTRLRAESVCSRAALEACTTRFAGLRGVTRYIVGSANAAKANRSLRTAAEDANLFAGAANLLILAHAQFIDAAQPLAEARRAEGISVDIVDVAQVYRQFGLGSPDPAALRDYLGRAITERETRMVLLFGGDSYDYHNNLGLQTISHVPSSYVAYDNISRYVPSDADIADLDRDGMPDLAIGRLPARTDAEAAAMVAKILAHDQHPGFGKAIMLADRGGFTARAQSLVELIPSAVAVQALQLDASNTAAILRTQLLASLAQGVDVVNYHGHSAPTRWSFENILSTANVGQIQASSPFIANQLGCWNNYSVDPRSDSLARAMMGAPGAAAATLGPTGLADEFAEEGFARHLLPLLHRQGGRLGDAILAAKLAFQASAGVPAKDILLGFNLLGDPSMRLH